MRNGSSHSPRLESEDFGFRFSGHDQSVSDNRGNSAEEVIGEMGLVLVVVLGIVVAINLMLASFHIG